MSINKDRIKEFEKNHAKHVISKTVEKVNMELLLTLNDSTQLIQSKKCKDAVPYIMWNDFVNNYGTLAQKITGTYNRYSWGRKIFVNFGMTNIQTELSYPHPAILIYNFANTAIVVPITSDDKVTDFAADIEHCIIKVKQDGSIFPKDSIINIHQICSIHKERIINDLNCNVKDFVIDNNEIIRLNSFENYPIFYQNMNLLECIRMKLTSMTNNVYINQLLEDEAYNINRIIDLEKENTMLKKVIDNSEDI